ncbi:porin [Rhodoferax mekongensis]|uniref:Porin n=1 Tax=Rhodoferax mekongensis TaxID=3068341 RepID=A0ABZ0AYH3_9BURK|nr:porin [Rhodoferax sp. TBRC 17307]WNO04724.1 porin [Rhodoferax sp. TBRC 17307]
MKKTLIALAVLAASGASFAQVTITGTAAYGYRIDSAPTANASGFGIDSSNVTFAAQEDLGGGNTVKASLVLDKTNRTGTGGGDFGLNIGGAWGAIDMSLAEGSDYLSGDFVGLDGKVFGGLSATDGVSYKTPAIIPGLTFTVAHAEADQALGTGSAGNVYNKQRHNTLTAAYSAGPLSVNLGFRSYDNADLDADKKSRVRGKASYDFGVAKVGAGFVNTQLVQGNTADTNVGVSVPFGSLALAADYGWTKNAADQTRSGYGITAAYSLSKRTAVTAKYFNYLGAVGDSSNTTRTDLILSHSF